MTLDYSHIERIMQSYNQSITECMRELLFGVSFIDDFILFQENSPTVEDNHHFEHVLFELDDIYNRLLLNARAIIHHDKIWPKDRHDLADIVLKAGILKRKIDTQKTQEGILDEEDPDYISPLQTIEEVNELFYSTTTSYIH